MRKFIIISFIILYKSMGGMAQRTNLDSLVKISPKLPTVLEFRSRDFSEKLNTMPVKTFNTNERVRFCCCGGTPPLFLLDGIEVAHLDSLKIDPKDIASISVLKDKSSVSIYGKKGENGVIIITSKKK